MSVPFIQCCEKNCFQEIKDFIGPENYLLLRDKGLVEYGSIYGGSFFCKILDFKDQVTITPIEFYELLSGILDIGLTINCGNGLISLGARSSSIRLSNI